MSNMNWLHIDTDYKDELCKEIEYNVQIFFSKLDEAIDSADNLIILRNLSLYLKDNVAKLATKKVQKLNNERRTALKF